MRRAMVVVLEVLRDVLGDGFSTDRLEMVCADLGGTCEEAKEGEDDHDDNHVEGGTGGAARTGRKRMGRSSNRELSSVERRENDVGRDSLGAGDASSTSDGSPSLRERFHGKGRRSSAGISLRDGSDMIMGEGAARSPRSGIHPRPFLPHPGYFRRVSKSEMEELLGDSGEARVGSHPPTAEVR